MDSSTNSQISKDFGRKITTLRMQLGISQKELAAKSGVPLTAVRRCEQKGQIPLERYLAITSSLGAEIHVSLTKKPKKKVANSNALQPEPGVNNQQIFSSRREAKWQFRRKLLLTVANLLEKQSDQIWAEVSKTLTQLLHNPSASIQKSGKRWIRFAGNNPQATIRTIRTLFGPDTPESPRRHKLQDLSDGHPFSGLLPEATLRKLRKEAYAICGTNTPTKSYKS